ncbi:MAG TPA: hypothetical protein VKA74_09845 [Myxococcota bacterium]|nr:hypothetical protein [Myxococcota bacterium]
MNSHHIFGDELNRMLREQYPTGSVAIVVGLQPCPCGKDCGGFQFEPTIALGAPQNDRETLVAGLAQLFLQVSVSTMELGKLLGEDAVKLANEVQARAHSQATVELLQSMGAVDRPGEGADDAR